MQSETLTHAICLTAEAPSVGAFVGTSVGTLVAWEREIPSENVIASSAPTNQ